MRGIDFELEDKRLNRMEFVNIMIREKPVRKMPEGRKCSECHKVLSIYNINKRCLCHREDEFNRIF